MAAVGKRSGRKRGRPRLAPEEGKRFPLNMRTTKELRDKLRAAAQESGRSMTQEVEYRLERSFLDEEAKHKEFGGRGRYRMMLWYALTIEAAERTTGRSWEDDKETFWTATAAIRTMLHRGLPTGGRRFEVVADDMGRRLGEWLAESARNDRKQE